MDEMDPTITALEHARDVVQQKYLRSLEDSITNAEFTEHLAAQCETSEMFEMNEDCPQLKEKKKRESTASSSLPVQRQQVGALASFVKKVKRRAEAASARTGAPPTQDEEGGANIKAALGSCRVSDWDTDDASIVGDNDEASSENFSEELMDLTGWTNQRRSHGHNSDFVGLGYSTTISSFAASQNSGSGGIARSSDVGYRRLTHSQRRSEDRTRRFFRQEEGDKEMHLVFNAFKASKAKRAIKVCATVGGVSSEEKKKSNTQLPISKVVGDEHCSIVDSGSAVSIVPDVSALRDLDTSSTIKIMGFNASMSRSKGKGRVVGFARSSNGRQIVPLELKNVHCVPGAPHELLSVSNMIACGYRFHFSGKRSYIVTPAGDELDLLQKHGLYWLKWRAAVDPLEQVQRVNTKPRRQHSPNTAKHKQRHHHRTSDVSTRGVGDVSSSQLSFQGTDEAGLLQQVGIHKQPHEPVSSQRCPHEDCEHCNLSEVEGRRVPLKLLHRRLAHWNEDLIERMVKNRAVDLTLSDKTRCACDVCRASKPTRRHVSKEREELSEQTKPFQRVWTDLKGKVCKDFFGNQHIVTFTCEVTRWTCIFFAKTKSEVKNCYRDFLTWVKLRGFKVEHMNSDGGGEYTANENAKVISEFQKVSIEHGITQNFTSAHTPEMNGVAERLNRTIVEHTRALLLEAGLSREFWSLAAKHVVYVRNRLWHRHLQTSTNVGASPFQLVFGKAPKLKNLRVWGCDAWKLDHLHKSSTFDRKAKKMIFVGMSPNRKGWVLFDTATRKTSTTYHCTFDEDMGNRRCALRDFDLRQRKAGPGASADDERLAVLERALYDDSAEIEYAEPPGVDVSSTEEAYKAPADTDAPTSPPPIPQNGGSTQGVRDQTQQDTAPSRHQHANDQRNGGRCEDGSADQMVIPERRAAIGTPQDLTDEEFDFLKTALELNLPMVMQQRNPKRQRSESRFRYEKYKSAKTLREAKRLGAKWEDIVWDYARGYIDFSPTAASNATLVELVEAWENRGIESSPAAYVNGEGLVNSSNPLSSMSFEESIQQDYAHMAFEHLESLSHRAQRVLRQALGNQTLEQFAHCCASRIMFPEPLSVKEAMASEHAAEWKKAMQDEIDTLTRFNTFKVVPREDAVKHGKLVKSKWVFKVKHEADGSLQRFKARLVAKGFTQVPGTDFYETYSPVFSYTSLRTLMALAVDKDLQLDQWDLKSSFVQQKLDVEHMYMEPPEGYAKFLPDGRRAALHCQQSLYGLKQSSRLLHERLSKFLLKLGFKQLISDRCVFIKGKGADQVIVATWVDDIIMASARHNESARVNFDAQIRKEFEMSPWTNGQADWILNMNVTRDWKKGTLHLSQPKAIEKLAERFGLDDNKQKPHVPMSPTLKLNKPADDGVVPTSVFDYASAVGGLLYLSLTARPDVAQSVGVLSRFMNCPGQEHVEAAKKVIRYLYATKKYGIMYTKGKSGSPHYGSTSGPALQMFVHSRKATIAVNDATGDSCIVGTYCDADFAGDEGTRKSTTGIGMLLCGGLVYWSSKLQATVALSTAEAETIAATEAVKQLMHARLFLKELGFEQVGPSVVYEDNNAAISLAHGKEQSKRAKHYQLKVYFLNEQVNNGTFAYEKVTTKQQLADAFTKALPRDDFCRYRDWMGVVELPQ